MGWGATLYCYPARSCRTLYQHSTSEHILYEENTFYTQRTHSIYREHILYKENTLHDIVPTETLGRGRYAHNAAKEVQRRRRRLSLAAAVGAPPGTEHRAWRAAGAKVETVCLLQSKGHIVRCLQQHVQIWQLDMEAGVEPLPSPSSSSHQPLFTQLCEGLVCRAQGLAPCTVVCRRRRGALLHALCHVVAPHSKILAVSSS